MESQTIQLWPSGKSITYRGNGDYLEYRVDNAWTNSDKDLLKSIKAEILARKYIEQDILCCDSMLITDLMRDGFSGFDYEGIENQYPNSSEWDLSQCREWLDEHGVDFPDPNPWDAEENKDDLLATFADYLPNEDVCARLSTAELRLEIIARIEDNSDVLEDYRNAVDDNKYESPAEIYQWFRVSEWLGDKLKEIDECVLDNDYGCWWGRQACGQAVEMDGVFQEIARRII